MIDTKSQISDRKHTLVHYLVDLIETKFPDLIDFTSELSHSDQGSKVSIPQIKSILSFIRFNLKETEKLVKELEDDSEGQLFYAEFKSFYTTAHASFVELEQDYKDAEKKFESCVKFYGEDVATTTTEEFFAIFKSFCAAYNQCKIENQLALQREANAKKREEESLVSSIAINFV